MPHLSGRSRYFLKQADGSAHFIGPDRKTKERSPAVYRQETACSFESTAAIIVCIDEIHRFHQFMDKDQRAHQNQASQNAPEPEILRAKPVTDVPETQLGSHPAAEPVHPDKGIDE